MNQNSNFNTNTENKESWLTPPYIIKALGYFDLDPCCHYPMPWKTASRMISPPNDGLNEEWFGRVWLNPPYGRKTFDWLEKLSWHKSGVALIFARTETKGFHREIWEKAHSVAFFKGRLNFHKEDGTKGGTANAPSCLVSYSKEDTLAIDLAIMEEKINAKLIVLK